MSLGSSRKNGGIIENLSFKNFKYIETIEVIKYGERTKFWIYSDDDG
jgi:hypothetical protein